MSAIEPEPKEPIVETKEGTSRDAAADEVIRRHVAYSIAGGAIPIPIVDLTAVTAVQLDMLKQLAKTYEVEFDGASSRAFVTSITSALAGNMVARTGASLVKFVPGIGWLAGGIAEAVLTGASTYAVGNLFKRLFAERRPIEDLDFAAVKDEVASYFDKGREVARSMLDKVGGPFKRRGKK